MVAVISGAGLGLFGSSASTLGAAASGNATVGRGGDRVFVNSATGNLVIQSQDEVLSTLGSDLAIFRTYNSQGRLNDDNADNWRLGVHQRLFGPTGSINSTGSTIIKVFGDGAEVVYSYDGSRYVSTEGDGADDTLSYSAGQWTWTDGTSRRTETYDAAGRLISSRDVDGHTVAYNYDTGGLLTSIVDGAGQTTTFSYGEGNLTQIEVATPDGTQIRTRYYYDASDRLEQVVVDLTPTDGYTPEDNNSDGIYDTVNGEAYVTRYTYDGASRRVASITQGDGTSVKFTYEESDGQFRLKTYEEGASSTTVTANVTGYTVLAGDTWFSIAQAVYGVSDAGAAVALQAAMNNVSLNAGSHLTVPSSLPFLAVGRVTTLTYSQPVDTGGTTVNANGSMLATTQTVITQVPVDPYYAVQTGDTWESIAQRLYGSALLGELLRNALGNPTLTEPQQFASVPQLLTDSSSGITYILDQAAAGTAVSQNYLDDAGRLAGTLHADGSLTTYQYDDAGNLIGRRRHAQPPIAPVWYQDFSTSASGMTELPSAFMTHENGGVTVATHQQPEWEWGGIYGDRSYDFADEVIYRAEMTTGSSDSGRFFEFGATSNNGLVWYSAQFSGTSVNASVYDVDDGFATYLGEIENDATYVIEVTMGPSGSTLYVYEKGTDRAAGFQHSYTFPAWDESRFYVGTYAADWMVSNSVRLDNISESDSFGSLVGPWIAVEDAQDVIDTYAFDDQSYTVRSGDTWSSIALTLYGTTAVADELQAALGNPTLVQPQKLLDLPATLTQTTPSSAGHVLNGSSGSSIPTVQNYLDGDGRLIGTLHSDGSVSTYHYDALGNLIGRRLHEQPPIEPLWRQDFSADTSGMSELSSTFMTYENGAITVSTHQLPEWQWAGVYGDRSYAFAEQVVYRAEVTTAGNYGRFFEFGATSNDGTVWYNAQFNGNGVTAGVYDVDDGFNEYLGAVKDDATYVIEVVMGPSGSTLYVYEKGTDRAAGLQHSYQFSTWDQSRFYFGTYGADWMVDNSVRLDNITEATGPGVLVGPWIAVEDAQDVIDTYRTRTAVSHEDLSAATDQILTYTIDVPQGATELRIKLNGAGSSGNADLWMRYGTPVAPGEYDYFSAREGNNDGIVISAPVAGTYHLWVHGFEAFDGVDLQMSYVLSDLAGQSHTVQSADTWSSIALALYGTAAVADELQVALGNPTLTTGLILEDLPQVLWDENGTTTVTYPLDDDEVSTTELQVVTQTVPAYYTVQDTDTWTSITQTIYGTSDTAAVAALQMVLGSLTLTAGSHLTVPMSLTYGGNGSGTSQYLQTDVHDALLGVTRYIQDAQGRLTTVLSPTVNGTRLETRYAYDPQGNLETITEDPTGLNRITTFDYDANGNLTFTRDAHGNTVRRVYSSTNQLLTETHYEVRDPDGSGSAAASSPMTTRYVYDGEDHLRFVISAEGRVTEHRYFSNGQQHDGLLGTTLTYSNAAYDVGALAYDQSPTLSALMTWVQNRQPLGRTNYSYDLRGNLERTTSYAEVDSGGAGVGTPSIVQFVYDQRGLLLQAIDARGSSITPDAENDELPYSTTHTYDGLGRMLSTTQWLVDGRVRTTRTAYDDVGNRLVTTINNDSNTLVATSVYNKAGELTSIVQSTSGAAPLGTTTYYYDRNGRLRMVTDPTGLRSHALYDATGRKSADIDADGTLTVYTYNRANELVKTVEYANRLTPAAIADLLTAQGAPDDVDVSELINSLAALPDRDASQDRITRNVYNPDGSLAYQIDDAGAMTKYSYDGAGRLTEEVRYASTVGIDRAVDEVLPDAVSVTVNPTNDRRTRHFYDFDGKLRGTLDAQGYLVEYRYNPAGLLIEQIAYASQTSGTGSFAQLVNAAASGSNAANDIVSRFFYDGQGRRTGLLDAERYLTETVYDVAGQVIERTRYDKALDYSSGTTQQLLKDQIDATTKRHRTAYAYDGAGRVTQETFSQGTGLATASTVITYEYDDVGNLLSSTRVVGGVQRTAQVRYDAQGRVIQELTAEGSAHLDPGMNQAQIDAIWTQYSVSHAYDSAGRRISTTDQLGHRSLFYYNEDGQLRYTINAEGEVAETKYDALGRVREQIRYNTAIESSVLNGLDGGLVDAAVTAAVGGIDNAAVDASIETSYSYGSSIAQAVREVLTTSAEGAHVTQAFNAFGELRSERVRVDTLNTPTSVREHLYSYDRRGLLQVTQWDPNGLNTTEQRGYDAFGRLVSITDANSHINMFGYDRLGRRTASWDAIGIDRRIDYDAFGRILKTYDAHDNQTQYAYDDALRQMTITTPENLTITTRYYEDGQVLSVTDARGVVTRYEYDTNGRLHSVTNDPTSQTGGASILLESHAYDRAGRLHTSTDANGVVTELEYDAADRVLFRTVDPDGLALVTQYTYDGQGRVRDVVDPNGIRTRTSYDRDGRISSVAVDPDGLSLGTTYQYNLAGDTVTVTQGSLVTALDESGNVNHVAASGTRVTRYVYDALGRRTDEIVDPGSGVNPATLRPYLNLTTHYEYDAKGNVIRRTDGYGTDKARLTRFSYDANDRLILTIDALNGATATTYDVEGRVASVRRFANTVGSDGVPSLSALDRMEAYVYDQDGREIYVINAAGGVTRKECDGSGNVIRTVMYQDSVPPLTYYETAQQVEQHLTADPAVDRTARAVYDQLDRAAYRIDAMGGVTAYKYDGNGSVIETTAFATPRTDNDLPSVTAMNDWASGHADPRDRTTRQWYDEANRLRYTLDAEGYLTEQRYEDAQRRQTTIVYWTKPTIPPGVSEAQITARTGGVSVTAIDSLDQRTRTERDAAGRTYRVYDAFENFEQFGYDVVGNKTSFTNKKGDTWTYVYDANGRLLEERTPPVTVTHVNPAGAGLSGTSIDNVTLITRMTYDALGNVRSRHEGIMLSGGGEDLSRSRLTEYDYDTLGRQTEVKFPAVDIYNYETGVVDEGSHLHSTVTYDAFGNATYNVDVDGKRSYKVYDQLGRVIYELDAADADSNAVHYVTRHDYDTFGNEIALTRYATGVATPAYTNDRIDQAQLAGAVQSIADSERDRTITTSYDRLNRVSYVREPEVFVFDPTLGSPGGSSYVDHPVTFYVYNAFGEVTRESRLVHGNAVDTQSSLLATPAADNPAYAHTFYYHDRRGLLTAKVVSQDESHHYLTTYTYDETGDMASQTEWGRALSGFDPNSSSLPQNPAPALPSSAPGNIWGAPADGAFDRETSFVYDKLNRLATKTLRNVEYYDFSQSGDPARTGSHLTSYGYDALGNQTRVTVNNATTFTYYDKLGRVIGIAEPRRVLDASTGASATPYTELYRDVYGNLVKQVQYAGDAGALSVNSPRPTASTNPGMSDPSRDRTTLIRVDVHGHAIQTEDATHAVRFAAYNARGEVAKEWQVVRNIDPVTGGILEETLSTLYEYDALGRQIRVTEPQNGSAERISEADYNAFGEITAKRVIGTNGAEFYDYDRAGRVWRSNSGDGVTKVYLYDLAGNVTAEIRSQQRNLLTFSTPQQVAELTTQRMRTETVYDLLGHVRERREPTFEVAPDWYPIEAQFQIGLRPFVQPPEAIYRQIITNGVPEFIAEPAPWEQGGGYYFDLNILDFQRVAQGDYQYRLGPALTWTAPVSTIVTASFAYAGNGQAAQSLTVNRGISPTGNEWGVDLTGIADGTYSYEVTYTRDGIALEKAIGSFTIGNSGATLSINPTAGYPSTQVAPVSAVTGNARVLHWSRPTDLSITAVFRARLANTTGWTYSVTPQVLGDGTFGVDIGDYADGSWVYEIAYFRGGAQIAHAGGTFTATFTPSVRTVSNSSVYPNTAAIPVSGVTATYDGVAATTSISWTAPSDPAVTATLELAPQGTSSWQSYTAALTGNESTYYFMVENISKPPGSYTYRITHRLNGTVIALATGSLTITAATSTTTAALNVYTAPSDPAAVVGTVTAAGATLSWSASLEGNESGYDVTASITVQQAATTITRAATYVDSGMTRAFSVNLGDLAAGAWQYTINHIRSGVVVGAAAGSLSTTGQSQIRTVSSASVSPGASPPAADAVSGVSATHTGSTVKVSWNAPIDPRVTATLELSTNGVNWQLPYPAQLIGDESTGFRFEVELTQSPGTYFYRITNRAFDQSLATAVGALTITAATSTTTTDLEIYDFPADPGSAVGTVSTSGSTLSWSASLEGTESGYDLTASITLQQGATTYTRTPSYADSGATRSFSVNLGDLTAGTWQYTINHLRNGTIIGAKTGTFVTSGVSTPRQISGVSLTPDPAVPAPTAINAVNVSISSGITTMSWAAPLNPSATATLEIAPQGTSSWQSYTAALSGSESGYTFTVNNINKPAGTYTYRITQSAYGQVEVVATGTLTITAASSTTTTTATGSTPAPAWAAVATISASAAATAQASGGVASSATAVNDPVYGESGQIVGYTPRWDGTNVVNLSWLNVGSGTVSVVVGYRTTTGFDTSHSWSVSNVATGGSFNWTDTVPGDGTHGHGGISYINYVEVYEGATRIRYSGYTSSHTQLSWAAPSSSNAGAYVSFKPAGSSSWTGFATAVRSGGTFIADLSYLTNGTYEYQITQWPDVNNESGGTMSAAIGQFSVSGSSASVLSQSGTPTYLSGVTASTDRLYWNYAPVSGDVITVSLNDGAYNLTPVAYGGGNYYASFHGVPSGTYSYTIRYSRAGTLYLLGAGSVSFTTTTVSNPATVSASAPSNTLYSVAQIVPSTSNDTLSWSYPALGGVTTTATLTYSINGAAPVSVNYSGPASFTFSSVTGNQNAQIGYVISYRRNDTNTVYAYGSGTYNFTVTTPTIPGTLSGVTQADAYPTVPGVSALTDQGGGVMSWTPSALSGSLVQVRHRTSGGTWSAWANASTFGSGHSYNFSALANGSYEYEIQYLYAGQNPYRLDRGAITITHTTTNTPAQATAAAPSSHTEQPIANIVPTVSGSNSDVLTWNHSTGGVATTATLYYTINGGASQSASYTGPGSFAFSSVTGNQNAAIAYTIVYRRNDNNRVYAAGAGTFNFTVTTTPSPGTLSVVSQAPVYPSVPGVTGLTHTGNGVMRWNDAANNPGTDSVQVRYRLPAGAWSSWTNATPASGGYSFSFYGLADATYEYEIRYAAPGQDPYRFAKGAVTVTHTTITTPASATAGAAQNQTVSPLPNVAATASSDTLSWSHPAQGSTTVSFTYTLPGGSPQTVQYSGPGSFTFSAVTGNQSAVIPYTITYRDGTGAMYAYGSGVFSFIVNTTVAGANASDITQYDLANVPRRTQTVDRWGNVLSETDAAGNTTNYWYNQFDQLLITQQPQTDVLDTSGGIIQLTAQGAVPRGRPTTFNYYDLKGNLIAKANPQSVASGSGRPVAGSHDDTAVYNEVGQLLTEARLDDNNGGATVSKRHAYDVFGQRVQSIDELNYKTRYEYDGVGQMTGVAREIFTGIFTGDADDFPAVSRNSLFYVVNKYDYDEAGRRISETSGEFRDGTTTDEQETTRYWYDLHGNLIRTRLPLGIVTVPLNELQNTEIRYETLYEYDLNGNKIRETDGNGSYMTWSYDHFGRLLQHVQLTNASPLYSSEAYGHIGDTITYQYDYAGLLDLQQSAFGQNIDYHYDAAGHLTWIKDRGTQWGWSVQPGSPSHPAGLPLLFNVNRDTRYKYDAAGRRTGERVVIDGLLHQDSRTTYDELNRLDTVTDLRSSVQYSYDAAGNRTRILATVKDNLSATQTQDLWYVYDSMNRVKISQGVSTGGAIPEVTINTTQGVELNYNGRGDRTYSRTYGERLVENTDYIFNYYYERAGYDVERYSYDGLSRLVAIRREGDREDTDGVPLGQMIPKEVESRTYDRASRLRSQEQLTLRNPGNPFGAFDHRRSESTYDDNGRLLYQGTDILGSNNQWYRESGVHYGASYYSPGVEWPSYEGNPGGWTPSQWTPGYDAAGVLRGYIVYVYQSGNNILSYHTNHTFEYRLGETYQEVQHEAVSGSASGGQPPLLPGSTNRIYNINGEIVAFNDPSLNMNDPEVINNRIFATNAAGQVITTIAGAYSYNSITNAGLFRTVVDHTPDSFTGMIASQFYRYANGQYIGTFGLLQAESGVFFTSNFDTNYEPISSRYPAPTPAQVTIQAGDTLRSIAARIFGDGSLWYIIADANGMHEEGPDGDLSDKIGWSLRIPNEVISLSNNASSFKPFDISDALGDTTPYQPLPPLPRPKKGCGVIGQIIMLVVVVVVSFYLGPLIGKAFAGAFGGMFAAGSTAAVVAGTIGYGVGYGVGMAIGSAVGQGAAIAMGMQKEFDWKAVGAAAITGFLFPGGASGGFSLANVGSAVLRSAASQGVNILMGIQEEFNWKQLAASAVAAPVGYYVGNAVAQTNVGQFASQLVGGYASGWVTAKITHGKVDEAQIAADAFGNALGNSIVEGMQSTPAGELTPHERRMLGADGNRRRADRSEAQLNMPEPVIESPLDNNPDLFADLPMPTVEFSIESDVGVPRESLVSSGINGDLIDQAIARGIGAESFISDRSLDLPAPDVNLPAATSFALGTQPLTRERIAELGMSVEFDGMGQPLYGRSDYDAFQQLGKIMSSDASLLNKLGQVADWATYTVPDAQQRRQERLARESEWRRLDTIRSSPLGAAGYLGANLVGADERTQDLWLNLGAAADGLLMSAAALHGQTPQLVGAQTGIYPRVNWGGSIQAQGMPFEMRVLTHLPSGSGLPNSFKTFDAFVEASGLAVSAKTLNTLTPAKISSPGQVYSSIKTNIDAVATYKSSQLQGTVLSSDMIAIRELRIAVPAATTAAQWRQIDRAIEYGRKLPNPVNVVVIADH